MNSEVESVAFDWATAKQWQKQKELDRLATFGLKRCYMCEQTLPLSAFHRCLGRRDGLMARCKTCDCARSRKAQRRVRGNYAERYAERYPDRHQGTKQYRSALARGLVVPWPVCAVPECTCTTVQGHHADYSRPLDVVWLCSQHHSDAHRMTV